MLGQFDNDKFRRKPRTSNLLKFLIALPILFFILHYIYMLIQYQNLQIEIAKLQVPQLPPIINESETLNTLQEVKKELNSFIQEWQQSGKQASQMQTILSGMPNEFQNVQAKLDKVQGEVKQVKGQIGVSQNSNVQYSGEVKKIRTFIGVFTGFNVKGTEDPKYDYVKRRIAMRDTWFPENQNAIDELERDRNVVVRFVIGHIDNQEFEDQIQQEHDKFGGFMRIDHMESYTGLPQKTKTFFSLVASRYDADYIVKMDDDVYLKIDRLEGGIRQWEQMGADYIGCMKHGQVWKTPGTRWFEPMHLYLANDYHLHAYGSIYVIRGDIARDVILANKEKLRMLANEDTSVGMWMLGHNVTYFEDMRLCTPGCSAATIGVLNNACAGLCDPLADLYTVHTNEKCTAELQDPLPYLPSYPDHKDFEQMRV